MEVLARWQHGSLGVVPPGAFIGIAEQAGLIGELTAMLMEKSFKASAMLPDPQWLAFNVSPHLLHDLALPKQIREAASAAVFPLDRVVMELTESALLEDLRPHHRYSVYWKLLFFLAKTATEARCFARHRQN